MPKLMIDCINPNDFESVQDTVEQIQGKCNVTYFEEAQKRIEKGIAKSEHDAAKQISKETGESLPSVRCRIQRGNKKVQEVAQHEQLSETRFNTSDIDWTDFSWNPITGCKHNCDYCYGKDLAQRFKKTFPRGFEPHFRPERLSAPKNTPVTKNGNKVFVCSMSDMFGDWIPSDQINQILNVCKENPQWIYIFLTKNPKRYVEFSPYPDNFWIGSTVDTKERINPTKEAFENIKAKVKFLSCEPLREYIPLSYFTFAGEIKEKIKTTDIRFLKKKEYLINWCIIGAQSKTSKVPAMQPKMKDVKKMISEAFNYDIKVFLKDNLTSPVHEYP